MNQHVYKTEEEQIDDLKRWIKSYGPSVIIGIILAVALLYGWRYWKSYEHQRAVNASILYQEAVDAYQTKHSDILEKSINQLEEHYPHSPYAQYALFIEAKHQLENNDLQGAASSLLWIISHTKDKNLEAIARLRLSSIQIAEHNAKLAIDTLKAIKNPAFKGLASIKMADAYLALGDNKNAQIYYSAANEQLPDAANTMPTLSMKLESPSTSA